MPKTPLCLALLALVACRGDFEPDPTGPGVPPPPPPAGPAIPFRIGSFQPDEGRAVTVGNFGDLMVASWFSGTTDFDPGPEIVSRQTFGQQDIAVASYTQEGTFRWVMSLGGPGADVPVAIAATGDGGAVVVGHTSGGGSCAGRTLVGLGGRDILLMKVSSGGTCEWAQLIGGALDDEPAGVVVEEGGTIVVVGQFALTMDVDPGSGATLLVSRGETDAFLARYTAAGEFLDAVQGGGLGADAFTAIARAPNGELSVAGTFSGQASFGSALAPIVLQAQAGTDGVLLRFTPLLGLRYAVPLAGSGTVRPAALADEPDGSLIAYGDFDGTMDADPGSGAVLLQSEGARDLFIARYAGGSGVYAGMARRIGGPGDIAATALARSPNGDLHMAGWFQGTVDFDPGAGAALVTARGTGGAGDAFLATLAPLGAFRWVTPMGAVVSGDEALAIGYGLTRAPGGTLWITGRFAGRMDFDPGEAAAELQALGPATDQFVSRYGAATGGLAP